MTQLVVSTGLLRRKGCRILGKKVKLVCSKMLNMISEIRLGQGLVENNGMLP